jgi:uncharacterized repeat protein (TIGR01451 family)
LLVVFVLGAIVTTIALGPSHAGNSSARGNQADKPHLANSAKRSAAALGAPSSGIATTSSLTPFALLPLDSPEVVTLYAADCSTAKTSFVLGDTVCAKVEGGPSFNRRVALIDSFPLVRQFADITSDPQFISFTLPSGSTSVINGDTYDNRGVWRVNIVPESRFSVRVTASFTVSDPQAPEANLAIYKSNNTGDQTTAGSNVLFTIFVQNPGPDTAQNVTVTDNIPANTTFLSGEQNDAGPPNTFTCTFPDPNAATGATTCTIASLPAGQNASFTIVYNINDGTSAGTVISNTSTITSDTADGDNTDNTATSSLTVIAGAATNTCTLQCPDNITAIADTTENNQRGAHVTFDPATVTGDCGSVTATPASGSFFPVGDTVVNVSSETGGGSCSFTVTVVDNGTNPPTISCPANITADADANCVATVTLGTPTTTGDNVTVVGSRSDGQPMYDCDANGENCVRKAQDLPFSAGVTTVTWTAYSHDTPGPYANNADEVAHRVGSASCKQTVTVNDVTPPVITATDSTASADANCQAAIPDYSNAVTDNCACAANDNSQDCVGQHRITTTQTPAAGTLVGLGPHTVHITANDGSSNNGGAGNTSTKDVTFTVVDTTAPTIQCPANITTNTDPGVCSAVVLTGTATATDNCDSNPTITATRSDGQPLIAPYPKGTTTITWRATDSAGNYSECTQTVTVVDNQPPTITFNGQTPSMWPPNHSYHTFTAADFVASVSDNCDTLHISDIDIISATSDESENAAGSGNTLNDIVIASDCKSIQLRAERINTGNGRVYTITFRLRDTSGNITTGTAKVYSPKNQGETPVDDGPHYTVTGNCP